MTWTTFVAVVLRSVCGAGYAADIPEDCEEEMTTDKETHPVPLRNSSEGSSYQIVDLKHIVDGKWHRIVQVTYDDRTEFVTDGVIEAIIKRDGKTRGDQK